MPHPLLFVAQPSIAIYGSAQAAERHAAFSPGDGMLASPH